MGMNKVKEYRLRIVYDPETGEIKHLSEFDEGSLGYSLEVDGMILYISDEMGEFLDKNTDTDILGLS